MAKANIATKGKIKIILIPYENEIFKLRAKFLKLNRIFLFTSIIDTYYFKVKVNPMGKD